MRWKGRRRSSNVEDRRGSRRIGKGTSIGGGAAIILLIAALLLGQDPAEVLQTLDQTGAAPARPAAAQGSDEAAEFVSVVLADTEDTWNGVFSQAGARYQAPKLVLYTDAVQSACGYGSAASGPFYCPGDSKVYLDLGFLGELQRMGAPGDFAVAYVIAHEVGHHVQNLEGTARQIAELRGRASEQEANALQVLMELQADCYAGLWAHHAHTQRQILEAGDIEEGLGAAAAVGDDRLQRAAGRRVQPESFTHGSSAQRQHWFRRGLETGSVGACDTFAEAAR